MQQTLVILLLISVAVNTWLTLFTATRPDRRRTSAFSVLCCMLLIYTLGYLAEILATTVDGMKAALLIENFAIPNISGLYLLTSICLFAPSKYKKSYIYLSMIYGFISFFVVLTNDMHNLYYTSVEAVQNGASVFLKLGKGPLFFVNQATAVICLVGSYVFMFARYYRGSKKLRSQMIFFIIGSLITFSGSALNFLGFLPAGLDVVPLAMTLALMLFSISFVRDDLMDVVIRARNTAIETMDSAFIVLDNESDFLYCNNQAIRLFPKLQRFEGTEPISTLARWPAELSDLKENLQVNFDMGEGESLRHYRANANKIFKKKNLQIGFAVIITDVTEETLLIGQLEMLATTDPLTGILNRRKFFDMAARDIEVANRYERSTAIIMFDLDHFKRVNDVYGHMAGDEVLRRTANVIRDELRAYDIFGRVGGEEFMVFTQSPGQIGLFNFANRLRRVLESQEIVFGSNIIKFTASFGISEIAPGGDLNDAITRVDAALYRAKEEGRNRVCADNSCPLPQGNVFGLANSQAVSNGE